MTTDVSVAEARVQAARARLLATVGAVQDKLHPSNLAQDAMENAAQGVASAARKGAEIARTRPVAVAAIAGTIGLVLARGWIGDIFKRRHRDETAPATDGLDKRTSPAKPAKKG
ncbi:DUF3618 domain-containing protein [Sphingomonas sp. CJ20]